MKARRKAAEAEHTVSIDALGVVLEGADAVADVLDALAARDELLGPAVAADLTRHSISVTVTVVAISPGGHGGPPSARSARLLSLWGSRRSGCPQVLARS